MKAIRAEKVTFIDDEDEAISLLMEIDDLIGENLHEILDARDADREGHGKFRKDFAEEAALTQARRDENQGGAIFGGIEVLEEQLADERFSHAAGGGEQSHRRLELDRKHDGAKGLGMGVGAVEEPGIDAIREGVVGEAIVFEKIEGNRERRHGITGVRRVRAGRVSERHEGVGRPVIVEGERGGGFVAGLKIHGMHLVGGFGE
jgi:hypothetical protein